MAEPLFLSSRSSASGRSAIVSDEGTSVWLYLTEVGSTKPTRDCWLLSNPSASAHSLGFYRSRSLPPPAPITAVDSRGVVEPPSADRWSFLWSADGDAVAAATDGLVLGLAAMTHPRGFARYIVTSGPWGEPWDSALFDQLFAG